MPPIHADLVRIQMRYEALGEIAVNNLHIWVNGPTSDWGEATQNVADAVAAELTTEWGNLSNLFGHQAKLVRLDAYHLNNVDGKTLDKRTHVFPDGGLAGTGTSMLPAEVALGVSLYGYDPALYDPLGARKRGRIFLPFLNSSLPQGDGMVGNPQSVASEFATVIKALDAKSIEGGPAGTNVKLYPVIASRKFASIARIQTVRVDQLFDVQKRRQNAMDPAPKFAAIALDNSVPVVPA